jgi:tetratricopeptide (TPR) repeat protein
MIGIFIALLLNANLLFAQLEDDEFGEEQAEVICIPETLLTVYDNADYGEVGLNDIRQWYSFGSEYFKNKNYKSAIPYLWKVFVNDSTKYARNAIRKLADSYFKLQQADSTFISCYRGLERYPDKMYLHYLAGFLQDNLGRTECAIPHYEALVEDNPEKAEYLEKLAFLYYKMENEKAIEVQQKLVELVPTNSKYANDLAQFSEYFYGAGGGLEAYKKAWENDSENLDFAFKYGKAAYNAGEYKAALVPLNKVTEKKPDHTKAHEIIALCDESLERYSQAITEYKAILKVEPGNAEVMCAIANNYRYLNQFSNGRYWVNKALQVKPGFGLAHIAMAEIYEASVTYCQNKSNRKRKYDDGLVYERALKEYQKASKDPNYRSDARRRINSLKPYLPTDEEKFMNQNRKNLKENCYKSWIK